MSSEALRFNSSREGSQAQCPGQTGARLRLHGVDKFYGTQRVLKQLDLEIGSGEFVALVGRSGCGKSTLLRLVAGLEQADRGELWVDDCTSEPGAAQIRVLFQEARLLPWKTVLENVAIGLPESRKPAASSLLQQVGLGERQDEWPAVLSGGQKQRVALARGLVARPGLLLMDEPLGALDALTRIEMQRLIESLWQEQRFTALLVTHDVAEAVTLADRVVLLENGAITLDVAIPFARPRDRSLGEFAECEGQLLQRLLAPRR